MTSGSGLRITVRALGRGSAQLADLPAGTRVSFEGPYGIFTAEHRTAPHLAVIAAGIGVTPIRSLLEDAELAPGEATVLLRAGTQEERYLWPEVLRLVEPRGGRVYGMTGPRPPGIATWMTEEDLARGVTLRSVFPDLATSDVYICGPGPWTDLVVRDALAGGVPARSIHTERFGW